jgi:NhaP-type Na+/H+ or K+/H+ antiporter
VPRRPPPTSLVQNRSFALLAAVPIWLPGVSTGPIGVSAVLYAMEALRRTGHEEVWVVSSLVICASIAAHGITATPFIRRYGRWPAPPRIGAR